MVTADQETTVHVFAIGEDYIELFLGPPGQPLKRALEREWGIPAKTVDTFHRVYNPPMEYQKPCQLVFLLEMCGDRWVGPVPAADAFVLIQIARIKIPVRGEVYFTRRRNRVQWIGSRLQRTRFLTLMNLDITPSTVEIVVTLNNVIWLPDGESDRTILDGDFLKVEIFHSCHLTPKILAGGRFRGL